MRLLHHARSLSNRQRRGIALPGGLQPCVATRTCTNCSRIKRFVGQVSYDPSNPALSSNKCNCARSGAATAPAGRAESDAVGWRAAGCAGVRALRRETANGVTANWMARTRQGGARRNGQRRACARLAVKRHFGGGVFCWSRPVPHLRRCEGGPCVFRRIEFSAHESLARISNYLRWNCVQLVRSAQR